MALFSSGVIKAQLGLEDVIIETYYVANANDIAFSGVDPLPAGAKTYRMYVDMAPGWELQAIYGATNVGTGEVDTLVFRSTAPFWNHTDFGGLYGYNIQASRLDDNTVGLDSWLSTGRSSGSSGGTSAVLEVLPSEDTNGALPTHPHTPANLLINTDPLAGLPLTTEDGNLPFTSSITWTATPGLEGILDPVLNNVNSSALEVVVVDGALGVTVSLVGPTAANRVCIGQFTTAGVLSGQINLQLRRISDNLVEQYVAATPGAGQFTDPALTFGPNAAPSVVITTPTEGQNFGASALVSIAATATDTDGVIDSVNFYKDGILLATVQGPGPYNASFTTGLVTTTHQIVARAWDDAGGIANDTVNITVTGNNPPVVVLTAPSTAITGTTVNISATATDPDGITQIEFFFNGSSIGVDNSAPYTASFVATPAGVRVITATATDGLGATGSISQNITITNNVAPTVTVTSPTSGSFVPEGPVVISANAADTDGTVSQVEFFVNGLSIGVDNSGPSPFTFTWNAVFVGPFGANTISAVATDNFGLTGNSAIIPVNVINPLGSPYVVESVNQVCNEPTVCVPIKSISAISDVIGFDMVLTWDNTQIYPTGNVIKSGDLVNVNYFETDNSIDMTNQEMLISVFIDVDAPFGTDFTGVGDIVCVEFAKRPAFLSVDTTTVTVTDMQESYFNGVQDQNPVSPGVFTTFRNTVMTANVEFWEDRSPIGNSVPVNIQANNSIDCSLASAASPAALVGPVSTTNALGEFTYDLTNGLKITISKDIAATTDVQEVVNGFDALLTRRLIIDDISFTPSVYQAIAMDVNRDGVVSAGDVSQINQRAVLILDEFRQEWNYNSNGTPKPTYSASKDWQFIDNSAVAFDPAYLISSSFPADNGVGYSKRRVPQVPFCLNAPVSSFATCPVISDEEYVGIMYGDVNGNYKNSVNVLIRSSDAVNVGVGEAQFAENFVDVPVTFSSIEDINAIDLNLDFDGTKLQYHSLIASGIQAVGHFNDNDGKLRITSNSLDVLKEGEVAFLIRFNKLTDRTIEATDFNAAVGYLNGDKVNVEISTSGSVSNNDVRFDVYPNPTNDFLFIGISKDVTAEIVDMNGRVLVSNINVSANSRKSVDVSSLPSGLYTIRVFSNDYTSAQRFFVGK